MSKLWQIYYNTIFGALGGLIAWLLVGLIATGQWNVHLANAFSGAGVGLFIGGSIGAVEGAVIKRSPLRALIGAFGGGLAGMLSGAFGLLLGGMTFLVFKGGLLARMLGWMGLGLFLGVGQGIISLRFRRVSYGLVGGTLAGLAGGALYEVLTQAFLQQSGEVQVVLSALGLILIGASLGSIIPISVEILRRVGGDTGLIVVLNGRRANMEKEIIGSATIGSSDACDVFLPDGHVERRQAVIQKGARGFSIQNTGQGTAFMVGPVSVNPGGSVQLNDGDILTMGETQLRFRAR
jgi:hypothetical protein